MRLLTQENGLLCLADPKTAAELCVTSRQASSSPATGLFLLGLLEPPCVFFLPFLLAFRFPRSGIKPQLERAPAVLCWVMLSNNTLACLCTWAVRSFSCSNKHCICVFPKLSSCPVPDLYRISTLCPLCLFGFECCLSYHDVQMGQNFTPPEEDKQLIVVPSTSNQTRGPLSGYWCWISRMTLHSLLIIPAMKTLFSILY